MTSISEITKIKSNHYHLTKIKQVQSCAFHKGLLLLQYSWNPNPQTRGEICRQLLITCRLRRLQILPDSRGSMSSLGSLDGDSLAFDHE